MPHTHFTLSSFIYTWKLWTIQFSLVYKLHLSCCTTDKCGCREHRLYWLQDSIQSRWFSLFPPSSHQRQHQLFFGLRLAQTPSTLSAKVSRLFQWCWGYKPNSDLLMWKPNWCLIGTRCVCFGVCPRAEIKPVEVGEARKWWANDGCWQSPSEGSAFKQDFKDPGGPWGGGRAWGEADDSTEPLIFGFCPITAGHMV